MGGGGLTPKFDMSSLYIVKQNGSVGGGREREREREREQNNKNADFIK